MRQRNRTALLPAAWIAVLFSLAAAPPRPNVVIVMPDDVGYGDFSCLGSPVIKTPNIDALHAQSVRFTDFHVSPTCSPTRSALMTGRHEFKSGVTHTLAERERLSLKAITLPQVLKSAGYTTGIFGKWHLGDEDAYQPGKRGFDETFIHGAGGIGQTYPGSCGDAPGNTYFDPAILHNGVFEKTKGYCTDVFFNQALSWIDAKRHADAPFFAYITPNAAHAPLQVRKEDEDRYRGKVPEDVAKFYGMIANIDDNVGRLMGKLKEWGIEDNTLLIFLTDNGGTAGVKIFNAGMRGAKVTPYEGGTRVPSFWRWTSGFKGGKDATILACHHDILPTLAAIAGVPLTGDLKGQVEGRDLGPLLRNENPEWPTRTFVTHVGRWPKGKVREFRDKLCSIRDERYSLVENKELFDLKNDPGQTRNVAAQHPDVATRLREEYAKWWNDVLPRLENEDAVGPRVNPFKERYWKQFGGVPDEESLKKMGLDPSAKVPS